MPIYKPRTQHVLGRDACFQVDACILDFVFISDNTIIVLAFQY